VLSVSAHRVISRIEIELAHHGGNDNGNLPVTKQDFIDYGIHHDGVAPAIREAEALGFIRMKRGRGGNADFRQPNKFLLTFAQGRDSRANPPTHDWRKIKTMQESESIARAARANKNPDAVRFGLRRSEKNRNRSRKPEPASVPKFGIETSNSSVLDSRTTGSVRKPGPLSISRGGERSEPRLERRRNDASAVNVK
jgi:DNA-binding transcriptional MocR family regulator